MKTGKGFNKLHGVERHTPKVTILDSFTVWKDNNPDTGILSKSDFMPYIKSLRTEDYDHTEALFEFLRTKRRLANALKHRNDRGGNGYYWASFSKPMGSEGAKVMAHDELLELVNQYIDGKIIIDFTMDDLIDEGLS